MTFSRCKKIIRQRHAIKNLISHIKRKKNVATPLKPIKNPSKENLPTNKRINNRKLNGSSKLNLSPRLTSHTINLSSDVVVLFLITTKDLSVPKPYDFVVIPSRIISECHSQRRKATISNKTRFWKSPPFHDGWIA
ncbi:hypothetical protein PanWU01x14_366600 [Parasponia andersonii]|uniref:Uncharacterized protein n=1 Tax=Parasponia andersonii TaxID=3476 RepID=A0A2P5A5K6_PARAD|nr:hypothetical protein PanWU01x14_366600 [Parasponia andersonii]